MGFNITSMAVKKFTGGIIDFANEKVKEVLINSGGVVNDRCEKKLKIILMNAKMYGVDDYFVLYGIVLFERIYAVSLEKSIPQLKNHFDLLLIFVTCIILAQKINIDAELPFINWWCLEVVFSHISSVIMCEKSVLEWLNFNVWVEKKLIEIF
jgi:hypothetical protein